jgi:uncharacterized OsmC-like protein
MFASSLGSCMLTIIGIAANTHGFSIDGTTLEIEKIMAANPRRVAEIKIDVHFPKGANYTDKQKRIIEAAAKKCPVANSLHPDVIKNITYIYE